MMNFLRNYFFLQLLLVFLVLVFSVNAQEADSCGDYKNETICTDNIAGSGFTACQCRWCTSWFGLGSEKCVWTSDITCW